MKKAIIVTFCALLAGISFYGAYWYRINIANPQWEAWLEQGGDSFSSVPHSIDYPSIFFIAMGIATIGFALLRFNCIKQKVDKFFSSKMVDKFFSAKK